MSIPELTLVKAGAGAGKTYSIMENLVDWVQEEGLKPESILAVTFTNAAAAEMRERIRTELLNKNRKIDLNALDRAHITTIHSFGLSLIERFAYKKGLSPKPRQLSDGEKDHLIKHAIASIEAVEVLSQNLEKYGYTGTKVDDRFMSKSEQLRGDLLKIIQLFRNLGKGGSEESSNELQHLLEKSRDRVKGVYGDPLSADDLLADLLSALEKLKSGFENQEQMTAEIGTNKELRAFIKAVYQANNETLKDDWKLWIPLQGIDNPTNKLQNHRSFDELKGVWEGAKKLSEHPGPLQQALEQVEALITAASDALNSYQKGKKEAGLLDFGDMVQMANDILNDEECFEEITSEVGCLVIDEFQDTNPLQFTLLDRFRKAEIPTYIVGDLKQSIMGFQGADSRLFQHLLEQFPSNTKALPGNWRSTEQMMSFINPMAKTLYGDAYEILKPEATYKQGTKFKYPVRRITFEDNWIETATSSSDKKALNKEGDEFLVQHIMELVNSKTPITDRNTGELRPIAYSDISVLASKHNRLGQFASKLRAAGIAAQLAENGWYESESVQCLLDALQYLNNPSDHFAALSLLTNPLFQGDLQQALEGFYQNRQFSSPEIERIDALRATTVQEELFVEGKAVRVCDLTLKTQLIHLYETLNLDQRLQQLEEGDQLRANAMKLIGQAEAFAQTSHESLQAMAVFGKNAHTFRLWLKLLAEEDDRQPFASSAANDAVVLKTWHSSKGLEWPVVVVLDAHKEKKAKLPSMGVNYGAAIEGIEKMLEQGFVEYFPQMQDPQQKEKFFKELKSTEIETQRNLIYVVLTRAREFIILPWFEPSTGHKENSMCYHLESLFTPESEFQYEDIEAKAISVETAQTADANQQFRQHLLLNERNKAADIPASTSPSLHAFAEELEVVTESFTYTEALALPQNDKHASQIGTWMHRLYHVYFMKPARLDAAIAAGISAVDDKFEQAVKANLSAFKCFLETHWQATNYQCELATLSLNELGQTVSGTVDLLLETDKGYWLIDHKTDKEQHFAKHYPQLKAYAEALKLDKPLLGVAINWVRTGCLEIKYLNE